MAGHHEYQTPRGTAIRERHDIVYREAATPGAPAAMLQAPGPEAIAAGSGEWVVDTPSTLLFRYSAITFNGHRIHYDLPYATAVEGYPGLVVHGPIQATLILNFVAASLGRAPARFSYRGLAPAFAGSPIRVRRSPDSQIGYRADGRIRHHPHGSQGRRLKEGSVP